jgi:mannose-6-phosphate isomerase-like protein (cupin superfamily)
VTSIKPTILGPGRGERIGSGPAIATVMATRQTTNGAFTITETTVPPGFPGPPPHSHRELTDSFYVLEGTLTVHLDGEMVDIGPGSYACIPPNNIHTFSNRSVHPVRFLNINSPGGWEDYLRAIARLMKDGPPAPEEWREVMSRYDFVPAG